MHPIAFFSCFVSFHFHAAQAAKVPAVQSGNPLIILAYVAYQDIQ